jgi:intein/homing endonuclease
MDNILKLIGMYISDGSINNNIVNIFCLKDKKINFNKEYLNKLESINYNYSDGAIRINDKNILEFLQQFGRSAKDKHITKEFMHLSKRQSRILLDSLIEGDNINCNGYRRFGSISEDLINNVSILAFNCGYSSNIYISEEAGVTRYGKINLGSRVGSEIKITSKNTYYKISIIEKQTEPWANKKQNDSNTEKVYDYKGKVYCIEVPESHIYFMRNDMYSTPCWIGNSNRHG